MAMRTLHRPERIIRHAEFLVWLKLLILASYASSYVVPHPTTPATTDSALFAKKTPPKRKSQLGSTIAVNRIAYRNYEILETLEAGISLKGTEIKAIRDGKLNLRDGYVRPSDRSCVLHNVHVGLCTQVGNQFFQHEERRPRQLLVHKRQALKLKQQVEQKGMTVVPLKAYFNNQNRLKLEIALVRGKNVRDKRATIRERDLKRETNRIIKNFGV